MKAKDWAIRFKEAVGDEEALVSALTDYVSETCSLIKQRSKGSSTRTLPLVIFAAFKEQKQKWEAICRLLPVLDIMPFDMLIEGQFPEYRSFMASMTEKNHGTYMSL